MRFKDRFLPCATNTLVNTRQGRPLAQAARSLCDSLEQRRDLGTCPSFISLNVELVASRTSTPLGSRSHENRRRLDGDLLRGVERPPGVHARLFRRLAPCQEEAIMVKIRAASANRVHKRAERYCGQLQSYQYQALVQYTQVNACRSALAARSSASSGILQLRIF